MVKDCNVIQKRASKDALFYLSYILFILFDLYVEYFFNTDLKARPTLNEDGSVDFFNLNTMNHVKKDDLLARLTKEDPGDYGINVCGEQVKPRDVKRLKLKYGRNIYVNEDRTEAYCEVNGHVTLVDDKIFCFHIMIFLVQRD